jgi:2-dehydropantoate 2-reductase
VKICVVGAGAIGGFLAGKLALAGHEVSVLARGAHLEAIRRQGLTLIDQHGSLQQVVGVRAAEAGTVTELGEQELVFLALKAHQIGDVAPRLGALLGEATPVVALQNGLPWWSSIGTAERSRVAGWNRWTRAAALRSICRSSA